MTKKSKEIKRKQGTVGPPRGSAASLRGLLHKHRLWSMAGLTVLALLFLGLEVRWMLSQRPAVSNAQPVLATPKTMVRHPLTGAWFQEAIEPPNVFAAMIDEHEDARPQSGIDQAFLVIEAPVEAGIPRLIAFFDANESVEKIGAIRSARPYFVDWNSEFDALYAHVGGSNEALEKIVSGDTFNVNEFSHGSSFWRDQRRDAPHNTYTSTELLAAYLNNRTEAGVAPDVLYESWAFKDAEAISQQPVHSSVSIDFLAPTYLVGWDFDTAVGRYKRLVEGDEVKTLEGEQVLADNIGIVVTDVSVTDAVGRRKIRTIGEGKAWVMQDGKVIEATWKKPSASQRLRFFVGDQEVRMNVGQTWIEVVPSQFDVTFEKE